MLVVFLTSFLIFISVVVAQYSTIAVIAINDLHGRALPTLMQRQDNHQNYTYGGLQYMANLINIIKEENPDNTLILDAGDQFQGGIESSPLISNGKIMNDFYEAIGLHAQSIGNHQFDFGPAFLNPYYQQKKGTVLAANLRSQQDEEQIFPKQKVSEMYAFKNGIKIGVIGLSTIFTPITTNAFKNKLFPEYKFLQYKDIVITESQKLKKAGADAILVLGHIGNSCNITNKYGFWTADTDQPKCGVQDQTTKMFEDEVTKLINELPQGTIDGVIQGHRHKFAHHFLKGIPYLGTINGGFYFNVLYLKFYGKKLVQKVIEGPIPVCEKVFANTKTCEYMPKKKLAKAGQLVPFYFHNKLVKADPRLNAIFEQEWIPQMKGFMKVLVRSQIELKTKKYEECELSNLITSLMRDAVLSTDFVIINPGGFRTQWYPGFIQEQHFYNMFPFENYLISFDILGSELIQLLKIVQAGPLGFYPAAGLKQTVTADFNNRRFKHSLVNVTFDNGKKIIPEKMYRGMSVDFLLQGGDDFANVMGKVYTLRNQKNEGVTRDLIRPQLESLKVIREGSLIDPKNPRLVVIPA